MNLRSTEIANTDLLEAIRALAFIRDKHGRRPVDYKNLRSEELGSVYEALLELHPELNVSAGTFTLTTAAGNERKTTGSYYTPESLVQCLLDSALDPVVDEAIQQADPEAAILNLKVCDPACGSGHFLIAAAHRMAKRLAAIRTGDEEPSPEATQKALRDVIGRCIYGVDVNPMAVELCKVALWMESLEPGKPLSFLEHHIQCGNSLLGATPALLRKGIPDEAFTPIEGDEKAYCSKYKKQNKQEREKGQLTLLDERNEPWERLGDLATSLVNLNQIADDDIAGVQRKQTQYEEYVKSTPYLFSRFWADAWCAAFVWKKRQSEELLYPITDEVFRQIERNPFNAPHWMQREVEQLRDQYQFFHWHLAFPDVFQVGDKNTENKQNGWSGGFDTILGNPPWEHTELKEIEWFAMRKPEISIAAKSSERKKLISLLVDSDPVLYDVFLEDKRRHDGNSFLISNSGKYPLCGRGRVNTYAVFSELMLSLISNNGRVGCVVPTGIATDDTTKKFFSKVMHDRLLYSLYDFDNKEGFFPDVRGHQQFCLLTLCSQNAKEPLFSFFLRNIAELCDNDRKFTLSIEDVRTVNPNTGTCPVFRRKHDIELVKSIYSNVPVLISEGGIKHNSWNITFRQGTFNVASDSKCFKTSEQLISMGFYKEGQLYIKEKEKYVPLFDAKMAQQFNHRAANLSASGHEFRKISKESTSLEDLFNPNFSPEPMYWVQEGEAIKRLGEWQYKWLLGFKDITGTTSTFLGVFTIIPAVGVGHPFPLIFSSYPARFNAALLGNLNTSVVEYILRLKLQGLHLTYFYLKQLPILVPHSYEKRVPWLSVNVIVDWICSRVLELTYTAWDLQPFAQDCGYDGAPFRWNEERRFLLRCELDAAYFHLYGIQRDDVDYIMETFPIVKRKDEQKHRHYRTKDKILEIYDAMAKAMKTGQPYQTLLDPPPADPSVAHSPR
ncbi:Eco57I restriction-modification methylase domain-containing protein [Egbenema bharatensis]|uniref:Eco57I restriction-modification methylase domain-containing protein n=1 Tax=Egbenema bharatensis TaxID=3463334 RepID=UPI003A8C6BC9